MSLSKTDGSAAKVTDIHTVLEDVRTLRTRQDNMSAQMGALKRFASHTMSVGCLHLVE